MGLHSQVQKGRCYGTWREKMKWLLFLLLIPNLASAMTTPIIDHTAIAWNVAESVGIDAPKFLDLIRCESGLAGFQGKAIWGDKGESYGILQFKKHTFEKYSQQYSIDVPYEDYIGQIVLGAKMIKDNFSYKWKNCSVQVGFLPKN